ncbi:hypothetical protein [Mycolicibacterium conceptionense]|uniref:hypothetical protein n=1 Tax=Mycolicibacterium conceptionense TaxID=451644 RepID=UPI000B318793|nr:hypothetical protein [Mycolicibacterium conceptionense]
MSSTPDLPAFVSTIDDYLRLEQRHSPAEQMFATVLTDDFEIGFRGGHQWKGLNGLRLYLTQRDGIFDERLELRQVLSYVPVQEDVIELTTRLEFLPSLESSFAGQRRIHRCGLSHVADPHCRP